MWTHRIERLTRISGLRVSIELDQKPVSYGVILEKWQKDRAFCSRFNKILAEVPYSAFKWETPPVSQKTLQRPFEFVVLNAPELDRQQKAEAFAEHFNPPADRDVVVFSNLGGDAILVVPCEQTTPTAYGHLAAFVRKAPASQQNILWRKVGETMLNRLKSRQVWLSTAGAGVPWLHVRLDDHPKYYGYAPYRNPADSD